MSEIAGQATGPAERAPVRQSVECIVSGPSWRMDRRFFEKLAHGSGCLIESCAQRRKPSPLLPHSVFTVVASGEPEAVESFGRSLKEAVGADRGQWSKQDGDAVEVAKLFKQANDAARAGFKGAKAAVWTPTRVDDGGSGQVDLRVPASVGGDFPALMRRIGQQLESAGEAVEINVVEKSRGWFKGKDVSVTAQGRSSGLFEFLQLVTRAIQGQAVLVCVSPAEFAAKEPKPKSLGF